MNYHRSDMNLIRQLLSTGDKDRQKLFSLLNEARLSFCNFADSEDPTFIQVPSLSLQP